MIEPTIGRRVWYWPSAWDRGQRQDIETQPESIIQADGSQACDAGIVYVHGQRLVNLAVNDHNGRPHRRCSVRLIQPGDTIPTDGSAYAAWMPYQVQNKPAAA
jgi:hypothetical protein